MTEIFIIEEKRIYTTSANYLDEAIKRIKNKQGSLFKTEYKQLEKIHD